MKHKKFYKWRLIHVLKRSRLDMFRSRLVAFEKVRITQLNPGILEQFSRRKNCGRHKYPRKWLYLKRCTPPLPRLVRADLIKPCVMTQPKPYFEKS